MVPQANVDGLPNPFLDSFHFADDRSDRMVAQKRNFQPVVTASSAQPGVSFKLIKRKCGMSRRGPRATTVVSSSRTPVSIFVLLQARGTRGDPHIGIRIKFAQHLACGGVASSGCLL